MQTIVQYFSKITLVVDLPRPTARNEEVGKKRYLNIKVCDAYFEQQIIIAYAKAFKAAGGRHTQRRELPFFRSSARRYAWPSTLREGSAARGGADMPLASLGVWPEDIVHVVLRLRDGGKKVSGDAVRCSRAVACSVP